MEGRAEMYWIAIFAFVMVLPIGDWVGMGGMSIIVIILN